jgi:hypothetical protein
MSGIWRGRWCEQEEREKLGSMQQLVAANEKARI